MREPRSRRAALLAAALLTPLAAGAQDGVAPAGPAPAGFRIVVNAANPLGSVEREDLARIFLKQTSRWPDGAQARPVDQSVASLVRARFTEAILQRELAAVQAYWQKQIFAGRQSPPRVKASDAEVIAWLLGEPEGVGYVGPRTELPDGVRELRVVGSEAASEGDSEEDADG